MRKKIKQKIQYHANCRMIDVKPEARLWQDLCLDKLDKTELIMDLEDTFNITISSTYKILTVEELVQVVENLVKRRQL